jgi:hypothetical protein
VQDLVAVQRGISISELPVSEYGEMMDGQLSYIRRLGGFAVIVHLGSRPLG